MRLKYIFSSIILLIVSSVAPVYASTSQFIDSVGMININRNPGTELAYTFDTEQITSPDVVLNGSRFEIQTTGLYEIHYSLNWYIDDGNSPIRIKSKLRLNGNIELAGSYAYGWTAPMQERSPAVTNSASFYAELTAGDYVELRYLRAGAHNGNSFSIPGESSISLTLVGASSGSGGTGGGTGGTGGTTPTILASDHPNLVAHYKFDSSNGFSSPDETANNYDVNLNSGQTLVPGRNLQALNMGNSNDTVSSFAPIGDGHTISLWMHGTESSGGYFELGDGGSDYVIEVRWSTDSIVSYHGGWLISDGNNVMAGKFNKWTHIVVQHYSGDLKLWVDGTEVVANTNTFTNSSTFNLRVVYNPQVLVDDVRIFDKKLSQQEINDLYAE